MIVAALILAAYLIGAVPTSYLAARHFGGIDLREHGSKNLGATNLYRVLGAKFAYPVGFIDMAKGLVPVLAFPRLVDVGGWAPWVFGLSAILGHVFPIYMLFRGGKGVATAAGVGLGVAPLPLLASLAIWALVLGIGRIMSAASIAGAVAFPIFVLVFDRQNTLLLILGIALAGFILWTHRQNIRRLLAGTEPRLVRAGK